jgi:ribosomal protein S27E
MPDGAWTTRRVIVVGAAETPTESHVLVPDADDGSSAATVVPIVIMVGMLTLSVFVPPILLLNIPILIARAALTHTRKEWRERVRFTAITCPDCAAESKPADTRGALPVDVACPACGAALSVRPRPRVNLVVPPPDDGQP